MQKNLHLIAHVVSILILIFFLFADIYEPGKIYNYININIQNTNYFILASLVIYRVVFLNDG